MAEKTALTEAEAEVPAPTSVVDGALVEDVLVEEVSIDGMCGVY